MKTIVNNVTFAKNVQDVTLILDEKKSKLFEVKYVKSIVGLDGSVKHIFEHNGTEKVFKQDGDGFRMFTSKEMFEHDNSVAMSVIKLESSNKPHHAYRRVAEDDLVGIVSYTFVNGVPTEVDAPIVEFECKAHRCFCKITPVYDATVKIEEYFDSVESATNFHSYTITDIDGKEKQVEGRYSFILPTDEQMPIVKQLRELLLAAKDAGIGLIFDREVCVLHAINGRKAKLNWDGGDIGLKLGEVSLPDEMFISNIVCDYSSDNYTNLVPVQTKEEK